MQELVLTGALAILVRDLDGSRDAVAARLLPTVRRSSPRKPQMAGLVVSQSMAQSATIVPRGAVCRHERITGREAVIAQPIDRETWRSYGTSSVTFLVSCRLDADPLADVEGQTAPLEHRSRTVVTFTDLEHDQECGFSRATGGVVGIRVGMMLVGLAMQMTALGDEISMAPEGCCFS